MIVKINGEAQDVRAQTLAALLDELDYGDATVATALQPKRIRQLDRAATKLQDGDEVAILTPRQGG